MPQLLVEQALRRRLPHQGRGVDHRRALPHHPDARPLARLENLRVLHLSGTRVTNEGVRELQAARQLVELNLEATGVGDDGR